MHVTLGLRPSVMIWFARNGLLKQASTSSLIGHANLSHNRETKRNPVGVFSQSRISFFDLNLPRIGRQTVRDNVYKEGTEDSLSAAAVEKLEAESTSIPSVKAG